MLIITHPSPVHEEHVNHIGQLLIDYLGSLPQLAEKGWRAATNLDLHFTPTSKEWGVPDLAIVHRDTPFVVVEVLFTTQGIPTIAKCKKWLNGHDHLVGAILVEIEEIGGWSKPAEIQPQLSAAAFEECLSKITTVDQGVYVGGRCWFKANKCTITVMLNGDEIHQLCPCVSSLSIVMIIPI